MDIYICGYGNSSEQRLAGLADPVNASGRYQVNAEQAFRQLSEEMRRLMLLNPDVAEIDLENMLTLARNVGRDYVEPIAALIGEVIEYYLKNPTKVLSGLILAEYFQYIEQSARLLSEAGEIVPSPLREKPESESVALVFREQLSSLDLCKVINRAGIPRELTKAVEACRRRNELLDSVVEYGLLILQHMDADAAQHWQLRYLTEHRTGLDPDIVRDFLSAWLALDTIRPECLIWVEQWSADADLLDQWPMVVKKADRLLLRHALDAWQQKSLPTNGSLAHLALLVRRKRTDDERLLSWLNNALVDVGKSVLTFMEMGRQGMDNNIPQEWYSAMIVREIKRLESLLVPVMLTANLILSQPNGAYSLAIAFFGLVGEGKAAWEKRLNKLAQDVVRRAFLRAAKAGRPPMEIIEKLTFGDAQALHHLGGQLDWKSERFDSLKQRELVVEHLAYFYASYREPQLLGGEISRRYRNLMRLLHEDNLRRIVLPEHLEQLQTSTTIRDFSGMIAAARRFLSQRRALENALEEMVSAEMDFEQSVRQLRLRIVHGLLFESSGSPGHQSVS